uniref:Uncharacterized protein n=1 Tax=Sphaerodactylus townsendi TaxID=933632 RepID=A0ACB8FBB6_9SAUR
MFDNMPLVTIHLPTPRNSLRTDSQKGGCVVERASTYHARTRLQVRPTVLQMQSPCPELASVWERTSFGQDREQQLPTRAGDTKLNKAGLCLKMSPPPPFIKGTGEAGGRRGRR